MRRRFFVEKFDRDRAELRGESAQHLAKVLRAEPGQLYELSDGSAVWLGRVARAAGSSVEFSLVERLDPRASPLEISVLLAVVKFDRFEWCLEKATELGAFRIIPLAAARSERRLLEAAPKRAARWRKILLESAQQARRLRVPELGEPVSPASACRSASADGRIILWENPDAPRERLVLEKGRAAGWKSCAVAIGPEGGWTSDEIESAETAGFTGISLGPSILRTETAVIAALAAVNYALGEAGPLD